jgi:lipopolysaccharide transport system permease protein
MEINRLKEIYQYREMLKNSIKKYLRGRYRGSALGFLWAFLNPLLMLIIYFVIFSKVLKVEVPNGNYAIFLFIGLIPWTSFNAVAQQSTTVITDNSDLIKKAYFPRMILPIATTTSNLINMLLAFFIMFGALFICKTPLTIFFLYLPLIVAIQTILTLAVSNIISAVTFYFRDLEHITPVLMSILFYLTPVLYPTSYIPQTYLTLFKLNPMMHIITAYQNILLFGKVPDSAGVIYSFIFSVCLLVISYFLFETLQKRFAEE